VRLGGASQDLSAAASLLGHSEKKSADDLVSHPRFCFSCLEKSFRGGLLPAFLMLITYWTDPICSPSRDWFCVRDFSWGALQRINENQTTKSHEPGITNPVNAFKHVIAFLCDRAGSSPPLNVRPLF